MPSVPHLEPVDPAYAERVRASFARQGLLAHMGAALTLIEPGRVEIALPFRPEVTQQHGFFHAGAVTTIADTAAGYAAYTLMPAGSSVLTVELKINLVAPAQGERLVARGRVRKAGRTLTVVEAEVVGQQGGAETPVALMLATMICLRDRPDGPGARPASPGSA
ncbi:MAG TPA: PaaI family thioesterase [Geminicoccaceae bacterium]|nr:PaaI family thioesterase [Geminicoccaceae bacterium]